MVKYGRWRDRNEINRNGEVEKRGGSALSFTSAFGALPLLQRSPAVRTSSF